MVDLHGPCAEHGHVICFLVAMARSRRAEDTRQNLCVAYYPEILSLLAHPYEQLDHSDMLLSFQRCSSAVRPYIVALEAEPGGLRRADDLTGVDVTCGFIVRDDDPPEMQVKPGGKFGFIWTGTYWRVLLRGPCPGPPKCDVGPRCIEAATYASSNGFCTWRNEDGKPSVGFSVDPINNPGVVGFIEHERRRVGCTGRCRFCRAGGQEHQEKAVANKRKGSGKGRKK